MAEKQCWSSLPSRQHKLGHIYIKALADPTDVLICLVDRIVNLNHSQIPLNTPKKSESVSLIADARYDREIGHCKFLWGMGKAYIQQLLSSC